MWAEYQIAIPWLLMAMGDVTTGGGAVIGGDADVGGDFTGRDRGPVNVYNQFGEREPTRPQRGDTVTDRVDRIELYLYGDGMSLPGVLRQQNEIIRQQAELLQCMASMMFWLYTVTAVLIILVVLAIVSIFTQ